MSITYDLIIKYLLPQNLQQNNETQSSSIVEENFTTPKNIYAYKKTFPKFFQDFICDNTFRYGVTVEHKSDNISFWSSLLTLLDSDFIVPFNDSEIEKINNFKTQLLAQYPSTYHINKLDIREKIKLIPSYDIIQYIVDVIDINIIIFNFKTLETNILYKGNIMNPYKCIFILCRYDDLFEPIMCNNDSPTRHFSYNDNFIKKILDSNIVYYDKKKEVLINDNINVIINNEESKHKPNTIDISNQTKTKNTPVFIKESSVVPTPDKIMSHTTLVKLTKDKLIEIAQSLGINEPLIKVVKSKIADLIINAKTNKK
jgi:hypothetical protein